MADGIVELARAVVTMTAFLATTCVFGVYLVATVRLSWTERISAFVLCTTVFFAFYIGFVTFEFLDFGPFSGVLICVSTCSILLTTSRVLWLARFKFTLHHVLIAFIFTSGLAACIAWHVRTATINRKVGERLEAEVAYDDWDRVTMMIANSRTTNADVKLCKKLKYLKHLELSGSRVSNSCIEDIIPLKRLQILDIRNTNIDRSAMPTLIRFSQLKELRVSGHGFHAKDVAYMRTCLQNCNVTVHGEHDHNGNAGGQEE